MDIIRQFGETMPEIKVLLYGLGILIAVLLAGASVGLYIKLGKAIKIFAQKPVLSIFLFAFYIGALWLGYLFINNIVQGVLP
jgi:hypothetical protein